MARHTRLDVLNAVHDAGVVPIFYNAQFETARSIALACRDGGIRAIEFTNRGDHAWEVFSELDRWAASDAPDLILGAGSIQDAPTAALYIANGANFIVSPATDDATARVCNRRKIAYMPGCGSVTEIAHAEELGCEIVKLFPGDSVGGPAFVKATRAPMPWTSIMPTGGVDGSRDSLKAWFDSGVPAVGMGSALVSSDIVADGAWDTLTQRCQDVLASIKDIRGR
ncbi:MAG: bifunctional 4-hydroxy-2-oxoglutarate aldolase/2-dehydro-3-deoxy-phosphogluconate aldolase [Chloroflexi bacterium]|nr:bifunctional 4-hydroxy-2-oxoglutarate aldolase/2-dehydro-3-deoxy-phosphogluconate aldolase [Chloroflexota bacterium]MBT4072866.1 bifunctional 4-hydroxy-2-oxoglutarate aldolase/2-dehydro-3-deoxy-phosphogluconate aldolase [Chloroflexota bacterium]MBT4514682.1 bifunctional 4-hydroxy-2-oxoglutarate aldolase/2-dehydro-3-deoxy-phosphogluconate aldolase [Chloroflexota bacterium]MBT5320666.1 bifunctional 4-hydroxy-2-oxoglutarate aldolase/2-dehydro-3-deoxy-phosphogluconate aldolase [Chloroflexota bact